ncbi:helix-turn-helix transcriptional regulator [Streptomyces durmitorensis]|uniref:Helix-turn-helix domain-containing protein n=1 Tax=Streptomyces durmitorensis TaxID=319947 RepID=A0ABY4PVN6_9ACTN|nr:helix-turn-helix transcriptional regulator [Streptomyces durmitorensis]UQT57117.1 helix-turn-helix domain-containing protein [Streptomyces durmitorensis]
MGAGDLAELLRELKERSGLSYGALAKRLHMSTSTLHRYVSGSAVPTEFAPLERLARVCGASREEMVEVHRRWILADASRGDRKEGEQGQVQQGQGQQGEPPAVAAPEAAAAPSGHGRSGSGAQGDGDSHGGDSDDGAPGIVIGRAPTAAGRREGRRLPRARVLVAAGVVLALGATAVAVQAASGGGDRDHVSSDSPSTFEGERERSPDDAGSASPSGKGSGKESEKGKPGKGAKGSAEPGGDGKDSGGETRGPGTGDGTGDGGKGGGTGKAGVPMTVSTQPQYWDSPCGHPYLVDKDPGDLSPPPNEQDAAGWVDANGAVSARNQTVMLTVQGTGGDTVVLESLNVRVAGTSAPLAWNNYKMGYLGVGCGGKVPQHSFDVNLDASVPRLSPQSAGDSFPYQVSESDPEAFYINATANSRYVRWYLELRWSSGARHGTVRIDDTGKPFATSGDQGRQVYGFSLNSKKWTKTNRDNDDVPDPPA